MSARFFTFVGAKGGTGVSTIVAELAKTLKEEQPTVLIDADLSGRRSAGILFEAVRDLDVSHEQERAIATARAQGVTLLELVQSYESAFTLSTAEVEAAVQSLETGIALVDAPLPFTATARPIIARTARFFVVIEPSVLGVAAGRTMIAQMKQFGIPAERIAVVLCSRTSRGIAHAEVERLLSAPVIAEIPAYEDRNFARAMLSLQRAVSGAPEESMLTALAPSDSGEIRDRRSSKRSQPAGSTIGEVALPSTNGKHAPQQPGREAIKAEIHQTLAKTVNLLDASKVQGDAAKLADLRFRIGEIAQDVIRRSNTSESAETVAQIKEEVVNEALGLGPLEAFMHDPEVTEIMVNGPHSVYVERMGIIHDTTTRFVDADQLRLVIERIVTPLGRRVDESVPMVDARLPDGSRVNAIIEPLALDGPTLTIRRFGTRRLTSDDLLAKRSVNQQIFDFLKACVEARLNIVISGGTGSGKTTFMNILSAYLPPRERIVTIEDAAELCLNQPHVVRLESRPPNLEGTGQITIRDLVRNALRMRPDRIVVGECRGAEALDMLQAMNTGHDGSLTTVHANSARDALARIETMVLMAGFDLPVRAIREQVSSAIDIIIQTARMRDGSRKIVSVNEIVGMEGDVITMQEIVRFAQHGVDQDNRVRGEFEYTGVQPIALKQFEEYGVPFDARTFSSMPLVTTLW